MATKLPSNKDENWATKILWKRHQSNEFQRVDNYKEGYCFGCFTRKDAGATIVDVCLDCGMKRGHEPVLAKISEKFYGYCMICGEYKFKLLHMNVRFCHRCYTKIRKNMKKLRQQGTDATDPFYKHLRRKLGKDWKYLMSDGVSFPGI